MEWHSVRFFGTYCIYTSSMICCVNSSYTFCFGYSTQKLRGLAPLDENGSLHLIWLRVLPLCLPDEYYRPLALLEADPTYSSSAKIVALPDQSIGGGDDGVIYTVTSVSVQHWTYCCVAL